MTDKPKRFCPRCLKDVEAKLQRWRRESDNRQTLYRCPHCKGYIT